MSAEPLPHAFATDHFSNNDWSVYRTRFLVRAKQLTEPVTFTDALGREHRGEPGDYLVQSAEGLLRVAPRAIFEDVYVALEQPSEPRFPAATAQLQPRLANLPA